MKYIVCLPVTYLTLALHPLGPSTLLQMTSFHSFSWLNNALLYIYLHPHIFIHSHGSEHLGCFHILGIANNTAALFFYVSFFLFVHFSPELSLWFHDIMKFRFSLSVCVFLSIISFSKNNMLEDKL